MKRLISSLLAASMLLSGMGTSVLADTAKTPVTDYGYFEAFDGDKDSFLGELTTGGEAVRGTSTTDKEHKSFLQFNLVNGTSSWSNSVKSRVERAAGENLAVEFDVSAQNLKSAGSTRMEFRFLSSTSSTYRVNVQGGEIFGTTANNKTIGTSGKIGAKPSAVSGLSGSDNVGWHRYRFVFEPVTYKQNEKDCQGLRIKSILIDGHEALIAEPSTYTTNFTTKVENAYIWANVDGDGSLKGGDLGAFTGVAFCPLGSVKDGTVNYNVNVDNLSVIAYNAATEQIPERLALYNAIAAAYDSLDKKDTAVFMAEAAAFEAVIDNAVEVYNNSAAAQTALDAEIPKLEAAEQAYLAQCIEYTYEYNDFYTFEDGVLPSNFAMSGAEASVEGSTTNTLSVKTDGGYLHENYLKYDLPNKKNSYTNTLTLSSAIPWSANKRTEVELDLLGSAGLKTNGYINLRFGASASYGVYLNTDGTINHENTNQLHGGNSSYGQIGTLPSEVKEDLFSNSGKWHRFKFVFDDMKYVFKGYESAELQGRKLVGLYIDGESVIANCTDNAEVPVIEFIDDGSKFYHSNPFVWTRITGNAAVETGKNIGNFATVNINPMGGKSYAYSQSIDNVSVISYDKTTHQPPRRGMLFNAIESAYDVYLANEGVEDFAAASVTMKAALDNALAVYYNVAATQAEMNACITALAEQEKLFVWEIDERFSYDFETNAQQEKFKTETYKYSSNSVPTYQVNETDVFDIGTSMVARAANMKYKIDGEEIYRDAVASKGLFVQLEYDAMLSGMVESTSDSIGAVTIVSVPEDNLGSVSYTHGGGLSFTRAVRSSGITESITPFWQGDHQFSKYQKNKWYRFKTVMELNKDGTLKNEGAMTYYINGRQVSDQNGNTAFKIHSTAFNHVQFIRFYATQTVFRVDNISFKTFKANNKPVEKGVLVSDIRDFMKKYPEYKSLTEVKELIDAAVAVYYDDAATQAQVDEAVQLVADATELAYPAAIAVMEDFEKTPDGFFAATNGNVTYADDAAYGIGKAALLSAGRAEKTFAEIDLTANHAVAEFDIKAPSGAKVVLGNALEHTVSANAAWQRVRIVMNNGQAKNYTDAANEVTTALADTTLSSIAFEGEGLSIDNLSVIYSASAESLSANKCKLIYELRRAEDFANSDSAGDEEKKAVVAAIDSRRELAENPVADNAAVATSADLLTLLLDSMSAEATGTEQEIIIPGTGYDQKNVAVMFNLHYGEQEGDISYRELFFNGASETDFSDVVFKDHNKDMLTADMMSHGNYDFIPDENLPNAFIGKLSDGTLVATKNSEIQFYNSQSGWTSTGIKGALSFVDMDDNLYYSSKTNDEVMGVYKMSPDDDYKTSKMVINWSNVDTPVFDLSVDIAQDDDGYIYLGRYTEDWIGAAYYVSSRGGEDFYIVDFRPDKQHSHTINVDRNVYPNRVFNTYDDSSSQPGVQFTTDHGGYEEAKTKPEFAAINPIDVRVSAENKRLPAEDSLADEVIAHAKNHFTPIPVPYNNSDYIGFAFVIDDSPEKFYEETTQTGAVKEYTTVDNVYVLGAGESNILGGPTAYKTTDIMNPDAYKQVIKTTTGVRRFASPVDGIVLCGAVAGNLAHTPYLAISYDDGDTWSTAYTESFDYSGGAGNGPFRFMTENFIPAGETEPQVLMSGYGSDASLRAKFGGDNYFGYTYVTIDTLPAEGLKLFVDLDKSQLPSVDYTYHTKTDGTAAVKASGIGDDVLAFPTDNSNENAVYMFDVETSSKTGVEAVLAAMDNIEEKKLLNVVMNTATGEITDKVTGQAIGNSNAVAAGKFTVKLEVRAAASADMWIDESFIANIPLAQTGMKVTNLLLSNSAVDGGDDVPEVYYSDVCYGDVTENAQFLLKKINISKNDVGVNELTSGCVIDSVEVEKLDAELNGATLVTALYKDGNTLSAVKLTEVTGSGSYDVGLAAGEDNLTVKVFMIKDLKTLKPVILKSIL